METGETIRIRKKEFVIGRADGDLTIPHDGQMSSRHAAIRLTVAKDATRWALVDLGSTNGTFVRVSHALLEDGSEIIVGRTRLRFENKLPAHATKAAPVEQTTQLWQPAPSSQDAPAIVEVTNDGSSRRVLLTKAEHWIGRDAAHCQTVLSGDPFASARHARIRCNEEGRWVVENNKSVNGVWLKVDQIVFKDSCRFMLGEQVFLVQVP
jgi:pSer/pThr/pTyr-binding forkhead associated (FHA) protein